MPGFRLARRCSRCLGWCLEVLRGRRWRLEQRWRPRPSWYLGRLSASGGCCRLRGRRGSGLLLRDWLRCRGLGGRRRIAVFVGRGRCRSAWFPAGCGGRGGRRFEESAVGRDPKFRVSIEWNCNRLAGWGWRVQCRSFQSGRQVRGCS